MGLIPLESNLYKSDLVVISHTIQLIEVDYFWHLKTFGVVLTDLQRRPDEDIHNRMTCPCTVQKMAKTSGSWMEKKLLTCVVKIGPQPVNSMMLKKIHNNQVRTQSKAKQSQGLRAKIGLKKIIKWLKQRKSK